MAARVAAGGHFLDQGFNRMRDALNTMDQGET